MHRSPVVISTPMTPTSAFSAMSLMSPIHAPAAPLTTSPMAPNSTPVPQTPRKTPRPSPWTPSPSSASAHVGIRKVGRSARFAHITAERCREMQDHFELEMFKASLEVVRRNTFKSARGNIHRYFVGSRKVVKPTKKHAAKSGLKKTMQALSLN